MSSLILHLSALLCITIYCCCSSFGLGFAPHPIAPITATRHYLSQDDVADSEKATAASSSFVNTDTSSASESASTLFPVISKIAGTEFTGSCRYINSKLQHVTNLKLFGGVKYEIIGSTQQQQEQQQVQLKLSSFLTFPNGQTRQVVMQGERCSSSSTTNDDNVMTLHPLDNDGPIIMKISEIIPDTILINEIEKNSGRIIMTSSISLVHTSRGGLELVGVSHEVGDDNNDDDSRSTETIEGHQIWRMRGPVVKEKVVLSGQFE